MRISFLFEPLNTPGGDGLESIVREWWRGLYESGHEIQVITRRNVAPPVGLPDRIQWAQAMRNWSWLELPRLTAALMNSKPQLVHLILGASPKPMGLWPGLGVLRGMRIPLVVSPGDACTWPASWNFVSRIIEPGQGETFTVPRMAGEMETVTPDPAAVFVPGPLMSHRDWRVTLDVLLNELERAPEKKHLLAWDWSEIPLPERLVWRKRWQSRVGHANWEARPGLSLPEQRQLARGFGQVRTEFLRQPSWQLAGWTSLQPLDQAINRLARSYRSMVESVHVSLAP